MKMKKIEVGQRVSIKCGADYVTEYGTICELFTNVSNIPSAYVQWDNGKYDVIHLTKIKSARAKYGLKLA
jgi:hypothetical protein